LQKRRSTSRARRAARGAGVGRAFLDRLAGVARDAGLWKLVSRVFPENAVSLALLDRAGFHHLL
jgi:phosphinothricin acetyltransferase